MALANRPLVSLGLASGTSFLAGLALSAGVAYAQQPNMQNALDSLLSAQSSLQMATPNKGGHRERALSLVSQAIAQVRAGIAYAGN